MTTTAFDSWLRNHPCDTETLWYIQNMLGTVLGFEHPLAQEAQKAWEDSRSTK